MQKLFKNKKIFIAISLVLTMIIIVSFINFDDGSESSDIDSDRLIDITLITRTDEYQPLAASATRAVAGQVAEIEVGKTNLPQIRFATAHAPETEWLDKQLILPPATTMPKPTVFTNTVSWSEVLPGVGIKYTLFDGMLEEAVVLENNTAQKDFQYTLTLAPGLSIREAGFGGHVMVVDSNDRELFMLRAPQGIDARNQRVDYSYSIAKKENSTANAYTLVMSPKRPQQFAKSFYPITIYPMVQVRDWDEVLVKIGDGVYERGNQMDGDIVTVKPAGWNWGVREYDDFLIVKIPRLSEIERQKYLAPRIVAEMSNEDITITDGPAYGIEYTKYVTRDDLAKIRDTDTKHAILDIRDRPLDEIFSQKKPGQVSVIPRMERLVYTTEKPAPKPWYDVLIKPVLAATTVTHTVGTGVGRDYSSLTAWDSAQNRSLTSSDQIAEAAVYNDGDISDSVNISGWTTDSTRYVRIYAPVGERHDGTEGSGARVVGDNSGTVIGVAEDYTRIEYMEIKGGGGNSSDETLDLEADNVRVAYSLLYDGNDHTIMLATASSLTIYNTAIYDSADSGIRADSSSATILAYNITCDTTSQSDSSCFQRDSGTFTVLNSIGLNSNVNDFAGTFSASNYNIASDTSAPGANSLQSRTATANCTPGAGNWVIFTNITGGSEDYHLQNCAENDALDVSSDQSSGLFSDDVDGETRSGSWDLGFDEFVISNFYPTITSVTDTPDPVYTDSNITFSIDWDDSGDSVRGFVCKTDSFASSTMTCSGGTWASSTSFATTDPVTMQYTASSTDIGSNTYYAFVCDDDNFCSNSTSGTFSVEAAPPTAIYRSMGFGSTSAIADGTGGRTLTISGNLATFSTSVPDNVGVGDAIQYDSDNNGSIDAIAFIHGRRSATVFTVATASGSTPTATSVADTDWGLYRAYTTMANAETGTENTGINATVRDFDTWSGGKDITFATGSNEQWNIALYADAPETGGVTASGWTTSATSYLRFFTPVTIDQVGVTQRHNGKWDTSKFYTSHTNGVMMIYNQPYTWFEGIQSITTSAWSGYGIYSSTANSINGVRIFNNILRANSGSAKVGINVNSAPTGGILRVYNNIIYDFVISGSKAIHNQDWDTFLYVYNNTVVNCDVGFDNNSPPGDRFTAKNNIIQNCNNGFANSFSTTSDNNISDIASDAPNATFSTGAISVLFAGADQDNYALDPDDTSAKDQGLDLSSDANLSFTTDINGEIRHPGSLWDIGADETKLVTGIKGGVNIKGGVDFR